MGVVVATSSGIVKWDTYILLRMGEFSLDQRIRINFDLVTVAVSLHLKSVRM